MRFLTLYALLILFSCLRASAQVNPNEYVEEKPPLMKYEWGFGVQLHTSGWGIDYRRGKNITGYKKRIFEGELVNFRHPKEIRSVNPYFDNAKSFFYGKLNSITVARVGTGRQRVLYSKAEKDGVEVRLLYSAGASIALAKPIYLFILYPTGFEGEFELIEEKYDPDRHYTDNIYGRAPFTRGLNEIKPYPGGYLKTGLSFEYGTYTNNIRCLEVGACLDVYYREVPIMALTENNAIFLNFYINWLFGKRW